MSNLSSIQPLFFSFTLALAACGGGSGEPPESDATIDNAGIPVEVLVAEPALFEDIIELTGTVDAPEDATVGAEASGTITYLAPLGAYVRPGGTIAQVNPSMAQATVASAQAGVAQAQAGIRAAQAQKQAAIAQLELAQDQHNRQEPLYRDSILSALEFRNVQTQLASARAQVAQADAGIAQARGALRQAQAGLQQAQTSYANTRVSTPFGGTVEAHLVQRGETVGPGMPVARVISGGGYRVAAGVPERYATDIENGTAVRILTSSGEGESLGGRVVFSGRAVDPASRTFPIEIALADPDNRLRPEMVVRLSISRAVLQDVVALPLTAIIRDERGTSVFVVKQTDAGMVAERRPVELGPSANGRTVISSGLEAGDSVIVSGQNSLDEGDLVRISQSRGSDELATNDE